MVEPNVPRVPLPGEGTDKAEPFAVATVKAREERQGFLLRLSDTLRAESSENAIAHRALEMLLEHLQVDRCYIGIYRMDENRVDFPHQVGNERVPALPDSVLLSDFAGIVRVAIDRTLVIADAEE